jgi:uncharacterized membrane protein
MKYPKRTILNILRSIPRKRIIEVGAAAAILLAIGALVPFMSPYSQNSQTYFYENAPEDITSLYKATVQEASSESLKAIIHDGPTAGSSVTVAYDENSYGQPLKPGTSILLSSSPTSNSFGFYDRYRIPGLVVLLSAFVLVVLLVGRRKGLKSLIGLSASILVIGFVLVPLVVGGFDSFTASLISAILIALVTILVTQGLNRKAGVILLSIGIVLAFVAIGSVIIVSLIGLTGRIDELSYFINALDSSISLSGLVTGGIIIATLGALDDIVTTQTATVEELLRTDKTLSNGDLFSKASRVGAEHISSLVNTLALVYVGAVLPIIVGNILSNNDVFSLLNSEFVATEVVRTVLISIGLVLAVPISTLLATVLLGNYHRKK